jgi:predicted DNA-binding antitoxin AbrB/MazE fold protein
MTIPTRTNKRRRDSMAGTIRARFTRGMLEPLERVDLPEGKEVTLTIIDVPSGRNFEAFRRSAGGWKGTIDAEALIKNIYADRLISTRPEPRL